MVGPKVKAFSWPKKHLSLDEGSSAASAIDIPNGPCLTRPPKHLLHSSISGDDTKWKTGAVDVLVPAYSDLHGSTAAKNPGCFFSLTLASDTGQASARRIVYGRGLVPEAV